MVEQLKNLAFSRLQTRHPLPQARRHRSSSAAPRRLASLGGDGSGRGARPAAFLAASPTGPIGAAASIPPLTLRDGAPATAPGKGRRVLFFNSDKAYGESSAAVADQWLDGTAARFSQASGGVTAIESTAAGSRPEPAEGAAACGSVSNVPAEDRGRQPQRRRRHWRRHSTDGGRPTTGAHLGPDASFGDRDLVYM